MAVAVVGELELAFVIGAPEVIGLIGARESGAIGEQVLQAIKPCPKSCVQRV